MTFLGNAQGGNPEHEREIKQRLDKLDKKICHIADLNNVDQELNE